MTVITKPLSQERKDEKPEKEVVNISENPTDVPCDDSLVVTSDSRSICVEIAGHTHVRKRSRSSPSRTLFVTKICLLIPALCSIIMGFSIVMHGIITIVPGRQMYRGYCRIPYPSTLFESGQLELSPAYLDWKYQRDVGPKTFGFAARLEEEDTSESVTRNKKYYRVVTGEFINPPHLESKTEEKKRQRALAAELLVKMAKELFKNKKGAPKNKEANESINKPKESPTLNGDLLPLTTEASQVAKDGQDLPANDFKGPQIGQAHVEKGPKYQEKNFELDFDIDIDADREELQMPELSKGKYLHDFKMNKTAIIDHVKKRCFVFDLSRKHIASPRSLYEIIHGMMKGSFAVNLQQIRQDMTLTYPAVNNFEEYGRHIKHECNGMTTYRLVPATPENIMMKKSNTDGDVDLTAQRVKKVGPSRIRRSANAVEAHADNNYLEFAGKYIQYNIVNLKEIE